jgi:hypothetical protein
MLEGAIEAAQLHFRLLSGVVLAVVVCSCTLTVPGGNSYFW